MRVLLLGGTGEALALARMLARDARFEAILSLAGATRAPVLPALRHRIGGFGGAEGLRAWLQGERIAALVDATHPYAVRISANAAMAAAGSFIPLLRIARPAWVPRPGERWIAAADAAAAAAALGPVPRRVLLSVGTRSLDAFRQVPMHRYVVRCIDAPGPSLLPHGATLLLARGPFALAGERALLEAHRIEMLVSKNSGGAATAAKLEAARLLGVTVVMIDRPLERGETAQAAGAAEAMQWLLSLHHCGPHGRRRKVMVRNAPIQDPAAAKQT